MAIELNSGSVVGRAAAAVRQQHWLSLMLLALHGALMLELTDPLARALLLSHFGFFLLWQPLWRGEQQLIRGQALLVLGAGVILIAAGSWWMIALWIAILLSLIGGNVPGQKNFRQRVISLLAALYLLAVLLTWVVPHLFPEQDFPPLLQTVVLYGLVVPAIAIFFVRAEKARAQSAHSVDLFYSLLLFLMVVVLVLGAFVIKLVSHGNYVLALAQALIVIAGLFVVLSLLWDPRAGFAGIGQLLTRYFLSIGMPFERWMHSLAALADRENDPDKFLILAAHEMSGLPWLSGIRWASRGSTGDAGEPSRHSTAFTFGSLTLTLLTRWTPSPTMVVHMRLLARLLGDYYEAKVREQEQRRNAYVQAIYETGSRLTHDVKNLLQTLRSLCAAAESSDENDADAVRLLMKRQLPQITQRLQITLDKLNTKPPIGKDAVSAAQWWEALKTRFAHEPVVFDAGPIPLDATVPADLFESMVENCLQNALEKRKLQSNLQIAVRLQFDDRPRLTICDSGTAIPEAQARTIFNAPVASNSGLGVGLYQVARFAREQGYEIVLSENQPGKVCFSLSALPGSDASAT